jgi:hypothetical protein
MTEERLRKEEKGKLASTLKRMSSSRPSRSCVCLLRTMMFIFVRSKSWMPPRKLNYKNLHIFKTLG